MTDFVGCSRALETTATEGTADYALDGVPGGGYVAIVDGIGDGKGAFFVVEGDPGTTDEDEREILWGTVQAGAPNKVLRTSVLDSTNGGSKVVWNAGTKTIFAIQPGELIAEIANVGYSASGTRPALITLRGKGLWIKADAAPRTLYFYNGALDIALLKIDETGGVVSLVGSGALLTSTDAGATGPVIDIHHDSPSPAPGDNPGSLKLSGNLADTDGTKVAYAEVQAEIVDPGNSTDGLADGALNLRALIAGALTTVARLADRLKLFRALETAKGADVASAATCDIWAAGDGNLLHVTGTTGISSFGTAPQAGAMRELIFDGALTITAGANLVLNGGGANVTTAAGDRARVRADTTTKMVVDIIRASGKAIIATSVALYQYQETTNTQSETYTASGWRDVNLNTEVADADGIGSISSKAITLGAGTYRFEATVLAMVVNGRAKCRILNDTDSAVVAMGTQIYTNDNTTSRAVPMTVYGVVTITGSKAFKLQIYPTVNSTAVQPVNSGDAEVYATLVVTKIA